MRRFMILAISLALTLGACSSEDPASSGPEPQPPETGGAAAAVIAAGAHPAGEPTASAAAGDAGAPQATAGHAGAAGAAGGSAGATAAAGAGGGAGYPPPIMYVPPPAPPPPPPPAKFDVGAQCVEAASCASGFCWGSGAPASCHAAAHPTIQQCYGSSCVTGTVIEGCDDFRFACINSTFRQPCSTVVDCTTAGVGGTCAGGVCSAPSP